MQYVKIKDMIEEQIASGMLSPRQKLPPERKLAESFGTTRVTLREALSLLEAEGKIFREDRRGWFIAPDPLVYDPARGLNFSEMARTQSRKPETDLILAKSVLANKQASALLALPPFTDVYHIERVHYLEDRPVMFAIKYVRPELFPDLLQYDLSQPLTDIYRDHYGVHYQKIRYQMCTCSLINNMAQALRATSGSPAMVIERVNYSTNDELIDCDIEYWRHDALRIVSFAELMVKPMQ
jgi:phosphonate utilization transcriptional regulator PhnR